MKTKQEILKKLDDMSQKRDMLYMASIKANNDKDEKLYQSIYCDIQNLGRQMDMLYWVLNVE